MSVHSKETGKMLFDGLVQDMQHRYGERVGGFLARRIATAFRRIDDPCTDNFRVADMAKPEEVAAYEEARKNGCCGSHDQEVTYYPTGQTFRFGFNYGH